MMSLLELDRVSKSFQRGLAELVALDCVSLAVEPGDFVAVWGASNSGKTTLLRVAAGIEVPDRGSVRFGGRDLTALSRRERTRLLLSEIGCAWRSIAASPRPSIEDRVATPLLDRLGPRRARQRAFGALMLVGAEACAGARWDELADGDRTRVAIAQALVREPRLLLADEPTVNLNIVEREEVLGVLRSVADERGTAVLMTAPDAPDAMRSHRIAALADGELIESPPSPPAPLIDFPKPPRRSGGRGA